MENNGFFETLAKKKIIQRRGENGILNYTAGKTSKLAQAQKTSTEFIEIRYRIWRHSV